MLIKKIQSHEKKNTEDCMVWEYEYPSNLFSFATAKINGRYPDKGQVANKECEEIYYVITGKAIVHSEKGNFIIEAGDVYFFEKGEKYYVEGDDLFLALVNAPKWNPKQHINIDG